MPAEWAVDDSSSIGSVNAGGVAAANSGSANWQTRYKRVEIINEGGYGTILRVRDIGSAMEYALKIPLSQHQEVLARFRREIEEQGKFHHDHVMPILDYGKDLDWFTMPVAAGSLLDRAPVMGDEPLLLAVEHVANGLQHAHSQGNVHRDVKPGNILLLQDKGPPGRWVISDFGLVQRPRGQTTAQRTKGAVGTEGYIAPEVLANPRGADHRADVFGLGRTIMWATTGMQPEPGRPSTASEEWLPLVLEMTELNVDDRIQDMGTVVARLGEVRRAVYARRRMQWQARKPAVMLKDYERDVLFASIRTS